MHYACSTKIKKDFLALHPALNFQAIFSENFLLQKSVASMIETLNTLKSFSKIMLLVCETRVG